eukprot:449454_1
MSAQTSAIIIPDSHSSSEYSKEIEKLESGSDSSSNTDLSSSSDPPLIRAISSARPSLKTDTDAVSSVDTPTSSSVKSVGTTAKSSGVNRDTANSSKANGVHQLLRFKRKRNLPRKHSLPVENAVASTSSSTVKKSVSNTGSDSRSSVEKVGKFASKAVHNVVSSESQSPKRRRTGQSRARRRRVIESDSEFESSCDSEYSSKSEGTISLSKVAESNLQRRLRMRRALAKPPTVSIPKEPDMIIDLCTPSQSETNTPTLSSPPKRLIPTKLSQRVSKKHAISRQKPVQKSSVKSRLGVIHRASKSPESHDSLYSIPSSDTQTLASPSMVEFSSDIRTKMSGLFKRLSQAERSAMFSIMVAEGFEDSDVPKLVSSESKSSLMSESKPSLGSKSKPSLVSNSNVSLGSKSKPSLGSKSKVSLGSKSKPSLGSKSKQSLGSESKPSLVPKSKPSLVPKSKPSLMSKSKQSTMHGSALPTVRRIGKSNQRISKSFALDDTPNQTRPLHSAPSTPPRKGNEATQRRFKFGRKKPPTPIAIPGLRTVLQQFYDRKYIPSAAQTVPNIIAILSNLTPRPPLTKTNKGTTSDQAYFTNLCATHLSDLREFIRLSDRRVRAARAVNPHLEPAHAPRAASHMRAIPLHSAEVSAPSGETARAPDKQVYRRPVKRRKHDRFSEVKNKFYR